MRAVLELLIIFLVAFAGWNRPYRDYFSSVKSPAASQDTAAASATASPEDPQVLYQTPVTNAAPTATPKRSSDWLNEPTILDPKKSERHR